MCTARLAAGFPKDMSHRITVLSADALASTFLRKGGNKSGNLLKTKSMKCKNSIYNSIKKNKMLRDNFGKSSTKEDLINWKNIPSHELDDNIRMAIFSKLIYRFNTIIGIPDDFFVEMIE